MADFTINIEYNVDGQTKYLRESFGLAEFGGAVPVAGDIFAHGSDLFRVIHRRFNPAQHSCILACEPLTD
ncbi:MAG: hypothetical protein M9932_02085 [Xanthobacteraceae bacterium]|nr:hypothetical protein [Xanthobacteraceae bacterium]